MMVLKLAILASIVANLGGCRDQHNNDAPSSADHNLVGTWQSGCHKVENDPFTKQTRIFSGQRFVFTSIQYSDAECKAEVMSNELSGSFLVGKTLNTPGGGSEIDLKDQKLFVTIKADLHLDAVNSSGWCGGGFVKSIPKELNSINCADDAELLDLLKDLFSIFKIDGNHLFVGDCTGKLGQGFDCLKENSRPENFTKDFLVKNPS